MEPHLLLTIFLSPAEMEPWNASSGHEVITKIFMLNSAEFLSAMLTVGILTFMSRKIAF